MVAVLPRSFNLMEFGDETVVTHAGESPGQRGDQSSGPFFGKRKATRQDLSTAICRRAGRRVDLLLVGRVSHEGRSAEKMYMPRLVDIVGSLLIGALSVQAQPVPNHYTGSKECGFEFDYPSGWLIVSTDDPTSCRVRLRPRDFVNRMNERDVDVYTLEVSPERGEFLEVAARNFFDFYRGNWVMRGRLGMRSVAEVVTIGQWHGVRGEAVVSCFDVAGGNAGLCEEPVLVLRDEDDNVWSMRGGPQSGPAFDMILATFRFVSL